MYTIKNLLHRCSLKVVAWFNVSNKVFTVLVCMTLVYYMPSLDGYFRPAVSSFVVNTDESYRSNNYVFLSGVLVKERCTFLGVSVSGKTEDGGSITLPILFQDNKVGQTVNREKGSQPFGPWRVYIDPPSTVWGIEISAAHECTLKGESKYFSNIGILKHVHWYISTQLGKVILLDSLKYVDK